jgi:hypothetical protein
MPLGDGGIPMSSPKWTARKKILFFTPSILSSVETLRIPLVLLIYETPLGAGGIPVSSPNPRKTLDHGRVEKQYRYPNLQNHNQKEKISC